MYVFILLEINFFIAFILLGIYIYGTKVFQLMREKINARLHKIEKQFKRNYSTNCWLEVNCRKLCMKKKLLKIHRQSTCMNTHMPDDYKSFSLFTTIFKFGSKYVLTEFVQIFD